MGGTCTRCHGTGVLYRQDCGAHGLTLPCPDCLIDAHDTHDEEFDDGTCWNCDGEGYVYGCSWNWQCDTYDEGEGTCLCSRRCEICNPVKLTPEQQAEKAVLQQVLRDILNEAAPHAGEAG